MMINSSKTPIASAQPVTSEEHYQYQPTRILCISERKGAGWSGRINVFTGRHYHYSKHSQVERPNKYLALEDARRLAKEVILR